MARLLFLSWGGAGNQVPALGLASAARERGHSVTFAGYDDQQDRIAAHGFDLRKLRRAQRAWPSIPPSDWMPVLVDAVWACPGQVDDLAELTTAERYDALVVDCLMFGALAGAERLGIPSAVLVHSSPGALLPPGGGLDMLALDRVNSLRTGIGLPTVEALWDTWRPFTTLCTSIPELDPLADEVPANVEYVGPVFEPIRTTWSPPWPGQDRRPLALVSFSTGAAWDQTSRIRRTLDALDDGRCRVLVTAGPFDVADATERSRAVVSEHVPHGLVLPHAAVTVTHAGHGTVAASLAHGVPIVALPNPAADQPALAAQVARLGAGVVLDGESAGADEIGAAVSDVLEDARYRQTAQELAARVAAMPGLDAAVDRLEACAAGREEGRAFH